MGKFFLLVGTAFALTLLAATAAFAGQGNGKPDQPGSQAAEVSHGNAYAYGRDKDRGQGEAQDQAGNQEEDQTQSSEESGDSDQGQPGRENHAQSGQAHGKAGGGNGGTGAAEKGGKSAEAQHHVILCHRTGSATNPYVVINVSVRAWEHGHTTHPELDGRSDILLKDPAVPGEKMDESLCDVGSGGGSGGGNGGGGNGGGSGGSGGNGGGHAGDAGGAGGSAGDVRGSDPGPVATGDLPFTGLSIWTPLLAAAVLIATGLALRRHARRAG